MSHEQHEVFRIVPFPFPDGRFPHELGAVVQKTVFAGQLPALSVIHAADGGWMIGDGVNDPNVPGACAVHCLAHIADLDPAISMTAALAPGYAAYREAVGDPWAVAPFDFDDDASGDH